MKKLLYAKLVAMLMVVGCTGEPEERLELGSLEQAAKGGEVAERVRFCL
jgi:hypothetical protein